MLWERLQRWRRRFEAGPEFLGLRPWRRGRYQSPTLTAALWLYALSLRHLTLSGAMVVLSCGLMGLYALFLLNLPIHVLAFSLAGMLALNLLAGFVFRPRTELERFLPERLAAGVEQVVTYTVRQGGRLPVWDLVLDPVPLPMALSLPRGRASAKALRPGEAVQLRTTVRAERRGRFLLPEPMAGSAFPFYLWRWTRPGRGPRVVTVYPSFTPLRELVLPGTMRYQAGGVALSSSVGGNLEFLGTREYRSGDDPRRLHWRSWARTTYPVVKEFREEYLCRTALLVDTARPRPYFWDAWRRAEDPVFEAGLSLAAAVAECLSRQDYIIDLFAAGPQVYRFQGGRSLGFLENILDILACLGPHHGEPFAEFSGDLLEEVARISSAVLVLVAWNAVRRALMAELRAAGVTVKAVLVTAGAEAPPDLPAEVRLVPAADIREGRCNQL